MKPHKPFFIFGCIILIFLWSSAAAAAQTPVKIKMGRGRAEVTLIKGKAFLVKNEKTVIRTLSKGDRLARGSQIRTGKGARIEVKLPDGSYMRFDEQTTFELTSLTVDREKKKRNVFVKMFLGKTWAKVSKRFKGRGRFALATKTAVAGVRGTVYRMNVKEDNSAMIKVYWGEILVEAKKRAEAGEEGPIMPKEKPKPVLGPQPIAGPRPVSMEEWTYIVSSLQQINIRPDGSAVKPFRFDIMADLNDWVRWNKERDELLKGEEYQEQ